MDVEEVQDLLNHLARLEMAPEIERMDRQTREELTA
jgi:hypothetical protein